MIKRIMLLVGVAVLCFYSCKGTNNQFSENIMLEICKKEFPEPKVVGVDYWCKGNYVQLKCIGKFSGDDGWFINVSREGLGALWFCKS